MKNFLFAAALLCTTHWATAQPASQAQVDNQYAVLEQLNLRTLDYTSDSTRQGVRVRADYTNYHYAIKGRVLRIQFNGFVSFPEGSKALEHAGLFIRAVHEVDLQDVTGVQLVDFNAGGTAGKRLVLTTRPNAVNELLETRESTGTKMADEKKKLIATDIVIERISSFADAGAEQQFIASFNQLLGCYQANKQ